MLKTKIIKISYQRLVLTAKAKPQFYRKKVTYSPTGERLIPSQDISSVIGNALSVSVGAKM